MRLPINRFTYGSYLLLTVNITHIQLVFMSTCYQEKVGTRYNKFYLTH